MANKVSYQTNFTGIKYNNNPLAVDINSFSNTNNVYLNKYGALISRSPVNAQDYSWQVYGVNPVPLHLKLVDKYSLVNGGTIYVIYNSNTELYLLRYKTPADIYSSIITSATITDYSKFQLVHYKQYYILFTSDGTRVLDTTDNTWKALSAVVDIPVTIIQTGNERLELTGNQLTESYKAQYIVKPDGDDTLYNLPSTPTTAKVTFPSQSAITYDLTNSTRHTRLRLLRKLNTPANMDMNGLVSIAGTTIAIAYSDRVHLSLDSGETFSTIPYPTITDTKYKNTASVSDDGLCFFYVHSDGVYRYEIGLERWTLIEVVGEPEYVPEAPYNSISIENQINSMVISVTAVGANYCHFINAEKFVFMLAHYRPNTDDWISVLYTKGLNITNYFDQALTGGKDVLCSFASYTTGTVPINIIGTTENLAIWTASPYLNKRLIQIIDDNTAIFYAKQTASIAIGIILKASPTHIYRYIPLQSTTHSRSVDYVNINTHSINSALAFELTHIRLVTENRINILVQRAVGAYWTPITITFAIVEDKTTDPVFWTYTNVFTIVASSNKLITGLGGTSLTSTFIDNKYYIRQSTLYEFDTNNTLVTQSALPIISGTTSIVTSGVDYLILDTANNQWLTNLPLLTTLTYEYPSSVEFTQVPQAIYSDQNLWLAFDKVLWIGNLVDNKLSMPAINNNNFAKPITGVIPISTINKAIFFNDTITLCEEVSNENMTAWYYYPLKFTVGIRNYDKIITTNDGRLTLFPTKFGLAALTYQLDIATTEQAITYLSDDIKSLWSEFYTASSRIDIIHHNYQLILSNGTNQLLMYDLRTNGWYPQTLPVNIKVGRIQSNNNNYELLELLASYTAINDRTNIYQMSKEHDELYSYTSPYKDLTTLAIPWHITSQILLLEAPNNYKNIAQIVVDQVDSHELKQSAYLTIQLFRQSGNLIKPSIELIYNIDTFAKIIKKVNWWKVLGLKWQLENDANSSYPTQLRLYNLSISYDVSQEVK